MGTYIMLNTFTEQGIRTIRDTTKRADAVRDLAKKFGAKERDIYWTLGSIDVVAIFDAPDEASITALALAIGANGNVRTQVLRALTRDEMSGVLGKLTQANAAVPA
jgi:uncharacterized protein with GYD domain